MNEIIKSSLLARNTLLNFIGQVIPLIVGVFAIPFIVRGLGIERFGILSLAWAILGYFAIFDLGLGRATTKFVAEVLGSRDKKQIPSIVWTAVTFQVILGFIGMFILIIFTPFLVEHVLNIPPKLHEETKTTFYILAFSIPVILVSGSFRGVLEAAQRFDFVNTVKIPVSVLTFIIPLIGVYLKFSLSNIVFLLFMVRLIALVIFVIINLRLIPQLKKFVASFAFFPRLFAFGGWITISNIVGPLLVYLDRFFIGSLLSMAAVTYYSTSYEVVTRLWIIPTSLTATLFPAFSSLWSIKNLEKIGILFSRGIKYIVLIQGPIVLVLILFAKDILQIWLGTEFAIESTTVMKILALGVFINSLAHIPYNFLQGLGRPDLTAKFHLIELPVYIGVALFLISRFGIIGAAIAWIIRVTLDTLLLFGATFKIYPLSFNLLTSKEVIRASLGLLIFMCMVYGLKIFMDFFPLVIRILIFLGIFILFFWLSWCFILDVSEKSVISRMVIFQKDS